MAQNVADRASEACRAWESGYAVLAFLVNAEILEQLFPDATELRLRAQVEPDLLHLPLQYHYEVFTEAICAQLRGFIPQTMTFRQKKKSRQKSRDIPLRNEDATRLFPWSFGWHPLGAGNRNLDADFADTKRAFVSKLREKSSQDEARVAFTENLIKPTAAHQRAWQMVFTTWRRDYPSLAHKDAPTEARDKYIYDQCCASTVYKRIILDVKKRPEWDRIDSISGIRRAAQRYAMRHGLPLPPLRQRGRPSRAKN